jgi:hypothetical protein
LTFVPFIRDCSVNNARPGKDGASSAPSKKDELPLSSPRKEPPAIPPKRKGSISPRPADDSSAIIADLQKKLKETEALLLFEKARVKELESRLKAADSHVSTSSHDEKLAEKLRTAEEKIQQLQDLLAMTSTASAAESASSAPAGAPAPPPPPPPPPPASGGPKKVSSQVEGPTEVLGDGPPPPPPPPPAGGPRPPPPPSGLKIAKKAAAPPAEKPKPAPAAAGGDLMSALAGFNRNNLKKNEGPDEATPKAAPAPSGPPNLAAIALQQRLKLKSASPKSPAPAKEPPAPQGPVFGLAALKKTGKRPAAAPGTDSAPAKADEPVPSAPISRPESDAKDGEPKVSDSPDNHSKEEGSTPSEVTEEPKSLLEGTAPVSSDDVKTNSAEESLPSASEVEQGDVPSISESP